MQGDQASIVGGAIDFVKELEQHLQSLEAEKYRRDSDGAAPFPGFFTSPQYRAYSGSLRQTSLAADEAGGGELTPENRAAAAAADVEVTVIQSHVNLKVLSPRQPGQLLKAIVAMEELNLTILHLNVTSLDHSALYSFNLKVSFLKHSSSSSYVFIITIQFVPPLSIYNKNLSNTITQMNHIYVSC